MEDTDTKNEGLEERILTLLSMNSRLGIDRLAAATGLSRNQVNNLVKKLVKKYNIRFVPEIGIDNLWKYEFLGMSWGKSKKELLSMMSQEEPAKVGFEQYMAMVEFKGKEEPSIEEIIKATEGPYAYMPQYIGRMSGQCNLFLYLVARNALEAGAFIYKLRNNLNKYNLTVKLQFVFPTFGYFPLNNKFIEQTQIQHRYKKLLLALNENVKMRLSSLSGEFGGVSNMTMSTMHAKLKELGLMKRATICMRKPKEQLIKLFVMSIIDSKKFLNNTDLLLMNIVKNSAKHYIFVANIKNPDGFIMIARFGSLLEAEQFKREFEDLDLGVEINESTLLENIYGNLGVRNLAGEETLQHALLKAKGFAELNQSNSNTTDWHASQPEKEAISNVFMPVS